MRMALTAVKVLAAAAALAATLAFFKPDLIPNALRLGAGPDGFTSSLPRPGSTRPTDAATTERAAPKRSGQAGPVAVEASPARLAKASGDIRAIGSLQSDESVQIASEIAGRIADIPFKEGQPVKAGDVIVKLDEALAKAEVTDAQARLTLATANNARATTLARTGVMAGRSRDEATSNYETAAAAVELAQTRLEKHTLRVPFDGVAGVRSVSVGAYIAIGAPIVNIEKIDALKVDFKVPEIYLQRIQVGQKISLTVDAIAGRSFDGEIYAIDPHVDVNGRALQIRARLPNPDKALRPGLFARINIQGLASREVTVIPESAIVPRGGEAFVYRIDNGRAVEARVKLGARKDAEVEILEGLDAKATVVTAGQQKLRDGAMVEIITATPAAPSSPGAPAAKRDPVGRSG